MNEFKIIEYYIWCIPEGRVWDQIYDQVTKDAGDIIYYDGDDPLLQLRNETVYSINREHILGIIQMAIAEYANE